MSTTKTIKTARLEARVSPELAELIERAADMEGLSKTGFMVRVLKKEAERVIRESEIIRLSVLDQERFAQAILDPPEPTAALKKAFARRRELLGAD
ncbi:DUF1778 domain-containing protein [Sulfidibacter corallicola]|uniref:DUF1778 domain-containing protein n=1 Tax=Sulfidibacter corallicola TaxID=2818388 RepID=A0A8A4TVW2_SULCO|nr:DUF1778 domain-containing protein [Sulfidibacter corallicola]QTD54096.1 DUF1778 domain-containing protein [Sulfidibacter corallicola]